MKLFITKVSTVFEVTVCKSTNKPLLELILDERYETKRERKKEGERKKERRENEGKGSRIKWWFHLESWHWKSTKEVQVRYLSLLFSLSLSLSYSHSHSCREKKKGENGSKLHGKRSSTVVFDLQQNVNLRKLFVCFPLLCRYVYIHIHIHIYICIYHTMYFVCILILWCLHICINLWALSGSKRYMIITLTSSHLVTFVLMMMIQEISFFISFCECNLNNRFLLLLLLLLFRNLKHPSSSFNELISQRRNKKKRRDLNYQRCNCYQTWDVSDSSAGIVSENKNRGKIEEKQRKNRGKIEEKQRNMTESCVWNLSQKNRKRKKLEKRERKSEAWFLIPSILDEVAGHETRKES